MAEVKLKTNGEKNASANKYQEEDEKRYSLQNQRVLRFGGGGKKELPGFI